jgi:hypothetical protein
MTFVDPDAIGECDARTQGGPIVALSGRLRTRQRAAECARATQSLIVWEPLRAKGLRVRERCVDAAL